MSMTEFSITLQNAEIFPDTFLKVDSITNALLAILKIVETLTGSLRFSFQCSYSWLDA